MFELKSGDTHRPVYIAELFYWALVLQLEQVNEARLGYTPNALINTQSAIFGATATIGQTVKLSHA